MPKGVLELDQSVLAKLNLMARGMNRAPEAIIAALIDGLDKRWQSEDLAILAECDARLARFRADRRGVPLDEVTEWIDSWLTDKEVSAPKCRVL